MNGLLQSLSAAETREWGTRLGSILQGGDVICLHGDLGAGKTAFAQGIGDALKILEPMTSPTYTFIQEYLSQVFGAVIRLIHMDLYRLQYPEEVEVIGVEDAFQPDSICIIEWPDIAVEYLPDNRLDLFIEGSGDEPRTLRFEVSSQDWVDRLKRIGCVKP
jgi:tRNA threonylcarbamoyladenosine biosynthesis protein TsaE